MLIGIEAFARADHAVPPAFLLVLRVDAGGVGVAREGVRDQDGVRTLGVQRSVGLVSYIDRSEGDPTIKLQGIESLRLRGNDHDWNPLG